MTTFQDLGVSAPILKALDAEGYTKPTPIQMQALPIVQKGKDLIGLAQTGTGKTAAFALPILDRLHKDRKFPGEKSCRTLVLAPTRELAAQIGESFRAYGKFLGLSTAVVFGGASSGFAFGGDDVYVNLGKFTQASPDEIAATVTHEVFHAVQARVMPSFPLKDWDGTGTAGPIWLRALLHNLAQEGTAELFTHVGPEGLTSAFSRDIALKNQRNAGRIAGILVMFESLAFRLASMPPVDARQYDEIYGLMFYETFDATAYQLGWVMAKAIEDRDGPAAIPRLLAQGPKAFLLRYQEIAQADPKLPRFGERFIALVRSL